MVSAWISRLFRRDTASRVSPKDDSHQAAASAARSPVAVLEQAIAAYRERRCDHAEPLFRAVVDHPLADPTDRHAARNILGALLERTRRTEEAITVYEANVAEGFAGSYPYERLAAIYRKQQRFDEEVKVLRQAVFVVDREFENGRVEVGPQRERLLTSLAEALERGAE